MVVVLTVDKFLNMCIIVAVVHVAIQQNFRDLRLRALWTSNPITTGMRDVVVLGAAGLCCLFDTVLTSTTPTMPSA
jgi:hypothetical protein